MKLSSTLGPRGPKVPYCRRTFGRDQGGWDGSAALGRWRAGKNADVSQNAVFYNVLGRRRDNSRMTPGWLLQGLGKNAGFAQNNIFYSVFVASKTWFGDTPPIRRYLKVSPLRISVMKINNGNQF